MLGPRPSETAPFHQSGFYRGCQEKHFPSEGTNRLRPSRETGLRCWKGRSYCPPTDPRQTLGKSSTAEREYTLDSDIHLPGCSLIKRGLSWLRIKLNIESRYNVEQRCRRAETSTDLSGERNQSCGSQKSAGSTFEDVRASCTRQMDHPSNPIELNHSCFTLSVKRTAWSCSMQSPREIKHMDCMCSDPEYSPSYSHIVMASKGKRGGNMCHMRHTRRMD